MRVSGSNSYTSLFLFTLTAFVVQISDALKYLEQLNAVHRDIAARNVLVADDGKTVKLSDFGMSTFLTSGTYIRLDGNELDRADVSGPF